MKNLKNGLVRTFIYLCVASAVALGLATIIATGSGGNGESNSDTPDVQGMTLSVSRASPGEIITVYHPSIVEDSLIEITFGLPGGNKVATNARGISPGAAKVAVPPRLDDENSHVFVPGEVTVSVMGASDTCTLYVEDLPEISDEMEPGEITRSLLHFSIDKLYSAQEKGETWALENDADATTYTNSLSTLIDTLEAMADELETGSLTVTTPSGIVVLSGDDLLMLDRLAAAHFLGLYKEFGERGATRSIKEFNILTREGWADILRWTKDVAVPGIQTLGSYVSVVCGVASFIPPTAPVAAPVAIGSTLIITVGAGGVSIVLDAGIDAIEGNDLDGYRYLRDASGVAVSGLVSIALTAAGGIEWVGQTLSGILALLNDALDGVESFIEVKCGVESQSLGTSLFSASSVSLEEFCAEAVEPPPLVVGLVEAPSSLDVGVLGTWTVSITGGAPPYLASFSWGDGGRDGVPTGGSTASRSHSYDSTREFTVNITVTDDHHNTQQVSAGVKVGTRELTVIFSTAPTSLSPGESGDWSLTVEGAVFPVSATFSWGDGTTSSIEAAGSSVAASHSYDVEGTYDVVATVTDNAGISGTASTAVTVESGSEASYAWNSPYECYEQEGTVYGWRWNVILSSSDGSVNGYIYFHNCPGGGRIAYNLSGIVIEDGTFEVSGTLIFAAGPLASYAPIQQDFILHVNEEPSPNFAP